MQSTLLAIGDLYLDGVKKAPSINKFIRYAKLLERRKIRFELLSYDDALLERLPPVTTRRLRIMLFFPYTYWNNNIERYDRDDRIYGDHNFGRDFKRLFLKIERILKDFYKDKDVKFVNPPRSCILDRDKIATAKLLRKNGILVPRTYNIKNLNHLERILDRTEALYIKPVFGSMGKGISVVTKKECFTNFIFRANKIISRPTDRNWKFVRISRKKRKSFLNLLIKKGFLFEEALTLPVVKRRRFDVRAHVIYGKIAYLFARSTPQTKFVTNWSQGGRMEKKRFLQGVISQKKLDEIEAVAKKTARIANLNYAGIDVILDKDLDKIYVLEIHSFPGHVRRFNLMRFLIDELT